MESLRISLLMTGWLGLAACSQNSSVFWHVSKLPSFLRINDIALCDIPHFAFLFLPGLCSCKHGNINPSSRPCFLVCGLCIHKCYLLGHLGVTAKFLVSCHTVLPPYCHLTPPPVKCGIKHSASLPTPAASPNCCGFFFKIVDTLVGVTSIPLWFDLYFLNNCWHWTFL